MQDINKILTWVFIFLVLILFAVDVCNEYDLALKRIETNRDIARSEHHVRKLEAEATIRTMRMKELELAQALVDKEGITYESSK